MSAVAEDRVLDYALHVLHRSAPSVDLTERVVEAWERGARGTSLRDLDDAPVRVLESPPAPRATNAAWRWRVAVAASLLAASGLVALWTARREAGPRTLARARAPALVFRAGAVNALSTTELRDGDVIAATSDASSTFVLEDGQRITAESGAIVALHAGERVVEVELLRGRASVEASRGELGLDLGFVRAVAADGAAFACELSPASNDPLDAGLIERLRARREQPGAVRFEVEHGELWLQHRGGRERLVAGVTREMWNAVTSYDADGGGEKKVQLWVGDMLGPVPWAALENLSWDEMFAYLATHPSRWTTLREAAWKRLDSAPKAAAVQMLAHFGLADPSGEGLAFARELWLRRPEGFSDVEIAALAERGLFEFEREASAMLAADDDSRPVAMVAALLARRGDVDAADALRRELDEPRGSSSDDFLRIAYAGYVLTELGDASAWRRAIDSLKPTLERDLREQRLADASACIHVVRLLDRALTEGRPVPLERLLGKELREAYAAPIGDAAAVRAELEELARRR